MDISFMLQELLTCYFTRYFNFSQDNIQNMPLMGWKIYNLGKTILGNTIQQRSVDTIIRV